MINRVMLVDDEHGILNALRRILARNASAELDRYGIKIEAFDSPVRALQRVREVAFAVVISDYRMPDMSGVELLSQIKPLQPSAVRMILSGYADLPTLIAAINDAQIHCFLSKPWDDDELRAAVVHALVLYEQTRDCEERADLARVKQGAMTRGEWTLKRLETRNPALARVNWSPDGGVLLDHEDEQ